MTASAVILTVFPGTAAQASTASVSQVDCDMIGLGGVLQALQTKFIVWSGATTTDLNTGTPACVQGDGALAVTYPGTLWVYVNATDVPATITYDYNGVSHSAVLTAQGSYDFLPTGGIVASVVEDGHEKVLVTLRSVTLS
ncbi:hypothetical protein [Streptomyces sp. NPDC047000]|uniref:hypothetical protein n=1 Tax=Streptomyces sp. NPDC047000 TaxID=3155474 RepID=UPI00340E530A